MTKTEIIDNDNVTHFINLLPKELTWQWDDKHNAMLCQFARDKKNEVLSVLYQEFEHVWDKHSVKRAPEQIKNQLGNLTSLTKEQLIFSSSSSHSTPSISAIWWPWDHGGTFSLRLILMKEGYTAITPLQPTFWQRIRDRFLS